MPLKRDSTISLSFKYPTILDDAGLKMSRNMILDFVLISFFSFFSQNVESFSHSSSKLCDFVPTEDLPYPTYGPIAIDTRNATLVKTATPLVIQNAVLGTFVVENNGYALEAHRTIMDDFGPGGYMYGGELCGHNYKLSFFRFYINQDIHGRSYATIDGESTPLSLQYIYFNTKYKNFNESLKHRDGIFILTYLIGFAPLSNLLFYPLEPVFPLFRNPGTKLIVGPAIFLYLWQNVLSSSYYGFPSSYLDVKTGKEYQCAFEIIAPIFRILGRDQFEIFSTLLGKNGTKLQTISKIYPQGERKLLEATTYAEKFVLYG